MKSLGLQVATVLVNTGRDSILMSCALLEQAAGYNYVNIDDCYAEMNRSADGFLIPGSFSGRELPNGHSKFFLTIMSLLVSFHRSNEVQKRVQLPNGRVALDGVVSLVLAFRFVLPHLL